MNGDITIYRPDASGQLAKVAVIPVRDAMEREAGESNLLPEGERACPWRGVYYLRHRPWANVRRWQAMPFCPRLKRYVYLGVYGTARQAAEAVARYLNCDLEALRK